MSHWPVPAIKRSTRYYRHGVERIPRALLYEARIYVALYLHMHARLFNTDMRWLRIENMGRRIGNFELFYIRKVYCAKVVEIHLKVFFVSA